MELRAAVIDSRDSVDVRTLRMDEPSAGEVRVRLEATGICELDVAMLRGALPLPRPFVPGHEGAGVVDAVGPGVDSVEVGDHVICTIVTRCGECAACVRREVPCIQADPVALTGTMLDGTVRLHEGGQRVHHAFCQSSFAEYTIIPVAAAIRIRRDAPLDMVAALGCGVGAGLSAAINRAGVTPGSTVLVLGAGSTGLAAMLGARLVGAGQVIAADGSHPKLKKALAVAADHAVNTSEDDLREVVGALTGGRGADVALDCTGTHGALEECIRATAAGGTSVAVNVLARRSGARDLPIVLTEKTLVGAHAGSVAVRRDIPVLVDLYMSGRLDLGAVMERWCTLDDVGHTLEQLEQGKISQGVIIH